MSADNWTVCPKCNSAAVLAREEAQLKAGAAYGKVPPAEYIAMTEEANKPVTTDSTLREDYELGLNEDGQFEVSYRCSCNNCKWQYKFAHSESAVSKPARRTT